MTTTALSNEANPQSRKLLTIAETADTLRVSKWTLYRLLQTNQLQSVRIGSRRLIPAAVVDRFIERQTDELNRW